MSMHAAGESTWQENHNTAERAPAQCLLRTTPVRPPA